MASPPPAPPPLTPKTGPKEGSLKHAIAFFPRRDKPSERPMDVVVFPSPALVGGMAVQRMSLAFLFPKLSFEESILALSYPKGIRASSSMPNFAAIFRISYSFFIFCFLPDVLDNPSSQRKSGRWTDG